MRLVRFGDTVVNMDRVNSIELGQDWARLYFSAPHTPNGIESLMADYTKLIGDDVAALWNWLHKHSEAAEAAPAPVPVTTPDVPVDDTTYDDR